MKPWGLYGHTRADLRYNDRMVPTLDALWVSECKRAVKRIGYAVRCGASKSPTREVPGRVSPQLHRLVFLCTLAQSAVLLLLQRHQCSRCSVAEAVEQPQPLLLLVVALSITGWVCAISLFGLSDSAWFRIFGVWTA